MTQATDQNLHGHNRQPDSKLKHLTCDLDSLLVHAFSDEPAHECIETNARRCAAPALHLAKPPLGAVDAFRAARAVDEYIEGVGIWGDAVDGGHLAVEADGIVVAAEAGEGVEDDIVELGGEWGVSGATEV